MMNWQSWLETFATVAPIEFVPLVTSSSLFKSDFNDSYTVFKEFCEQYQLYIMLYLNNC